MKNILENIVGLNPTIRSMASDWLKSEEATAVMAKYDGQSRLKHPDLDAYVDVCVARLCDPENYSLVTIHNNGTVVSSAVRIEKQSNSVMCDGFVFTESQFQTHILGKYGAHTFTTSVNPLADDLAACFYCQFSKNYRASNNITASDYVVLVKKHIDQLNSDFNRLVKSILKDDSDAGMLTRQVTADFMQDENPNNNWYKPFSEKSTENLSNIVQSGLGTTDTIKKLLWQLALRAEQDIEPIPGFSLEYNEHKSLNPNTAVVCYGNRNIAEISEAGTVSVFTGSSEEFDFDKIIYIEESDALKELFHALSVNASHRSLDYQPYQINDLVEALLNVSEMPDSDPKNIKLMASEVVKLVESNKVFHGINSFIHDNTAYEVVLESVVESNNVVAMEALTKSKIQAMTHNMSEGVLTLTLGALSTMLESNMSNETLLEQHAILSEKMAKIQHDDSLKVLDFGPSISLVR